MSRARADHSRPGWTRLHPADARAYWMASKIPSDQFLLYCFDSGSEDLDTVVARLYERSGRIEVLRRHITDVACGLDYPRWTEAGPRSDAISVHRTTSTWSECLDAIAASFTRQVDPRLSVWHLHLYPNIADAPGGTALVAVLQLSHAAADGTLSARTARDLFGTHPLPPASACTEPPAVFEAASTIVAAATVPLRLAQMVRGSVRARRDALSLGRGTDSGEIPPPAHSRALTALDVPPTGRTSVRTIVLPKSHLQSGGTTITTFVLTAVSVALQRLLGDGPDLAAEVTLARDARATRETISATSASDCFPPNRTSALAVDSSRPSWPRAVPARIIHSRRPPAHHRTPSKHTCLHFSPNGASRSSIRLQPLRRSPGTPSCPASRAAPQTSRSAAAPSDSPQASRPCPPP